VALTYDVARLPIGDLNITNLVGSDWFVIVNTAPQVQPVIIPDMLTPLLLFW
jgi:hypothetical protein